MESYKISEADYRNIIYKENKFGYFNPLTIEINQWTTFKYKIRFTIWKIYKYSLLSFFFQCFVNFW
jgi:hypothetical protein